MSLMNTLGLIIPLLEVPLRVHTPSYKILARVTYVSLYLAVGDVINQILIACMPYHVLICGFKKRWKFNL